MTNAIISNEYAEFLFPPQSEHKTYYREIGQLITDMPTCADPCTAKDRLNILINATGPQSVAEKMDYWQFMPAEKKSHAADQSIANMRHAIDIMAAERARQLMGAMLSKPDQGQPITEKDFALMGRLLTVLVPKPETRDLMFSAICRHVSSKSTCG